MSPGADATLQKFARRAMNTQFEIFLHTPEREYAAQAAAAAFDELIALESRLSRFLPNSEISAINALQPEESLVLSEETFDCLQRCFALMRATAGAFDITLGAQVDAARAGRTPGRRENIRPAEDWPPLRLDAGNFSVTRLGEAAFHLDLGGFGKGYAVDRMLEILEEWEAGPALVHGGRSSLRAGTAPAGRAGWEVQLSAPDSGQVLASGSIAGRAMGASGLQKQGHIIDPADGRPLRSGKRAVWVVTDDAATADALSTAFMIMPPTAVHDYCAAHPGLAALIYAEGRLMRFGDAVF